MKLVLVEKPSVAQSMAKVLGVNKRCDGYLEGNGYVAHVVTEIYQAPLGVQTVVPASIERETDKYYYPGIRKGFPDFSFIGGNNETGREYFRREKQA